MMNLPYVQANLTPIPANRDPQTGEWLVYIHVSFVKINTDQSLSKIRFVGPPEDKDYALVRDFLLHNPLGQFSLQFTGTPQPVSAPFSLVKPSLWGLFEKFRVDLAVDDTTGHYHTKASLKATIDTINGQATPLKQQASLLEAAMARDNSIVAELRQNIALYGEIIDDMTLSLQQLAADTTNIQRADPKFKGPGARFSQRSALYQSKRAKAQAVVRQNSDAAAGQNAKLQDLNTRIAGYEATIKALQDFSENKLVSLAQDNAVTTIENYWKGQAGTADEDTPLPVTFDTGKDESLTLTDMLAYFSAYPKFMAQLGLMIPVKLDKNTDLSSPATVLGITYAGDLSGLAINVKLHSVNYDFNKATGYFFPKSKTPGKYQNGFLNLKQQNPDGSPAFGLYQNSLDEIRKKVKSAAANEQDSDQTGGFYLTQNAPSATIENALTDDALSLENLLVGYRIDVQRVGYHWKSLNQRSYTFSFPNGDPLGDDDEGFIAANTVSKGYELVMDGGGNVLNIFALDPKVAKVYDYQVPAGDGVIVDFKVTVALDPSYTNTFVLAQDSLTIDIKQNQVPAFAFENYTMPLQSEFSTKKIAFNNRWVLIDNQGRLYFSGLKIDGDDAKNDLPTYVPSSLICHINGHNLSAPRYMGDKLVSYFSQVPVRVTKSQITYFMQDQRMHLEIKAPDNGLPYLRIGDDYRVRCRLAILGGFGPGPQDGDESSATDKVTYLRQDPVHAPKLHLTSDYAPGGGLHYLEELGDTEYQIIIRKDTDGHYPDTAARVIAPPSLEWKQAEWLKMMDEGELQSAVIMDTTFKNKRPKYHDTPTVVDPTTGKKIVRWEYGTGRYGKYLGPGDLSKAPYIGDNMASFFIIEPTFVYGVDRFTSDVSDLDFSDSGEVATKVREAAADRLGYLQQLFVRQFVKGGKPLFSFWDKNSARKSSDDCRPWVLNVVAIGGVFSAEKTCMTYSLSDRTITIQLQQGDDIEFTIRCVSPDVSNFYPKGTTQPSAYWKWREQKLTLFAERKFRAVYALMKPWNPHLDDIFRPETFVKQHFTPSRNISYPFDVVIDQGIYSLGRTSANTHLIAEWDELFDDVTDIEANNGSPVRVQRFHQKVFDYNSPGFFKTKDAAGNITMEELVPSPLFIQAKPVDTDDPKTIYADLEGLNLGFRHSLGSAKFHAVSYFMIGESRFRNHFKGTGDEFNSEATQPFSFNGTHSDYPLNATIAPKKPEVAYIVPLFHTNQDANYHKRFAGLRVYLKRPWYSSGYGEKVAVILDSGDPGNQGNTAYQSWVTGIGRDSTTGDPALTNLNIGKPENLPSTFNLSPTFMLPLAGGSTISVKPLLFDVIFDKSKLLWYADIGFDHDTYLAWYCPFIRLVLARIQPAAVRGVELSLPHACDFMQIYPERNLMINTDAGTIVITTSAVKQDAAKVAMSELRVWCLKAPLARQGTEFLLDETDLSGGFDPVSYQDGAFTYDYAVKGAKALIIREYELFDDPQKVNTHRLIYTHVFNIPKP